MGSFIKNRAEKAFFTHKIYSLGSEKLVEELEASGIGIGLIELCHVDNDAKENGMSGDFSCFRPRGL